MLNPGRNTSEIFIPRLEKRYKDNETVIYCEERSDEAITKGEIPRYARNDNSFGGIFKMKQIKKMPSLLYHLLILVLIAQMILSPYLAHAQGIDTKTGLLDIETTESGVTITIDQKEQGRAPLHDIPLSPGTHKVVAKKKGYEDWSDEVVVEPGVHSSIGVVLKKLGEAPIGPPIGETQVTPPTTIPEATTTPKPTKEVIQEQESHVIVDVFSEPPPPPCTRIWCRWWFWTLVLLVAGGGVAAAAGGGGGGGGGGAPGTTSSPTTGTVSVTW